MKDTTVAFFVVLFMWGVLFPANAQPQTARTLSENDLRSIIGQLDADDREAQLRAVSDLLPLAAEARRLIAFVDEQLGTEAPENRLEFLQALHGFSCKAEAIVSLLGEIIEDEGRELQWGAARILEPIVILGVKAGPVAWEALNDRDHPEVREAAERLFETLNFGQYQSIYEPLSELLESAFEALSMLKIDDHPAIGGLFRAFDTVVDSILRPLVAEADRLILFVDDQLESKAPEKRLEFLRALNAFSGKAKFVVPVLVETFVEGDRESRWRAARGLEPIAILSVKAGPCVSEALTDEDQPELQKAAMTLLETLDLARYRAVFEALSSLQDRDRPAGVAFSEALETMVDSISELWDKLEEAVEGGSVHDVHDRVAALLEVFLNATDNAIPPLIVTLRRLREPVKPEAPPAPPPFQPAPIIDRAELEQFLKEEWPDLGWQERDKVRERFKKKDVPADALARALGEILQEGDLLSLHGSALEVLGQLGEEAKAAEATLILYVQGGLEGLENWDWDHTRAVDILKAFDADFDPIVDQLIKRLEVPELQSDRLFETLDILNNIGRAAAKATPVVIQTFLRSDQTVKTESIRVLRRFGSVAEDAFKQDNTEGQAARAALTAYVKSGPADHNALSILRAITKDWTSVVDALIKQLEQPESSETAQVIRKLEYVSELESFSTQEPIGPTAAKASSLIVRFLWSDDEETSLASGKALRSFGLAAQDQFETINNALTDSHAHVRTAAAIAIQGLKDRAAPAVDNLMEALRKVPEDTDESAYSSPKTPFIEALEGIGRPAAKASKLLAEIVEASRGYGAKSAAEALIKIGPEANDAGPILIKVLNDPDHPNRDAAARALVGIGHKPPEEAAAALIGAVKSTDVEVKLAALRGLGELGVSNTAVLDQLMTSLKTDDIDERLAAIEAISSLAPESEEVAAALIRAVKSGEAKVKLAALPALGRLGVRNTAVLDQLKTSLKTHNIDERLAAVEAISSLTPESDEIVDALADAFPRGTELEGEDVSWEVSRLGSEIVSTIGKIGQPTAKAVKLLKEMAQSEDSWRRDEALGSLSTWGTQAIGPLTELIRLGTPEQGQKIPSDTLGDFLETAGTLAGNLQDEIKDVDPGELKIRQSLLESMEAAVLAAKTKERDWRSEEFSERKATSSKRIKRAQRAIQNEISLRQRMQISEWIQYVEKHPKLWVLFGYSFFPFIWFLLYIFAPIALLRLAESLGNLQTSVAGVTGPINYLVLLAPFARSRRVLDAWVIRHVNQATAAFENKRTVLDRSNHVPLPVHLDKQLLTDFTYEGLRSRLCERFAEKLVQLLIWGEGGAGKTSLACLIAKWGMSPRKSGRLAPHRMIPVLIESEFDDLHEAISSGLRDMLKLSRPVSRMFLGLLLQGRRLLVIVDHYSELRPETRTAFKVALGSGGINALMVTSRSPVPELGETTTTVIEPQRVEGSNLSTFLGAYLQQRVLRSFEKGGETFYPRARTYIHDSAFFEGCHHLSVMVEERPITVLLAKMFAEEMANAVEYDEDGPIVMRQLPDLSPNISEMMIRYIDELHRYETREGPELRRVHEDLRRIAWSCVEPALVPGEVSYSVIEQELMNAGLERDAITARLDYYAQGLGVLRYAAAGKETVRFALDPVAEYMAGLHLLDLFGGDEDLWRPFLERVERSVTESPNEDWSFLSALLSCCKAVGQRAGVSDEVITKLEKFTQVYLKAA